MKIWWVLHGQNEYTVFDFGETLISISDFDDYEFLDASFSLIKFPLSSTAEKHDITNKFWDYVPEDQKQFVKHSLIKTSFNG